jgi:hypothetical protein
MLASENLKNYNIDFSKCAYCAYCACIGEYDGIEILMHPNNYDIRLWLSENVRSTVQYSIFTYFEIYFPSWKLFAVFVILAAKLDVIFKM